MKALNIVDTKLTTYRIIPADHRHWHSSGKDDLRGQWVASHIPIGPEHTTRSSYKYDLFQREDETWLTAQGYRYICQRPKA